MQLFVDYLPIVSREPGTADTRIREGHVQDLLDEDRYRRLVGRPLDPDSCHVFLCGNPAMIESVRPMLEDRGFRARTRSKPGTIHTERYW